MAIQQHPLPQDISNYRFRLIGDMTIKQFASLGISIVLAIVVYSLPLPFFFKYPLSFLFVVLGVGMAFVPIQGRSLDVWIVAFIKSIYSPTQYSWKRTPAESITAETLTPSTGSSNLSTPPVSSARIELTQQKATPTAPSATVPETPEPTPPEPAADTLSDNKMSTVSDTTIAPVSEPVTTPSSSGQASQPEPLLPPTPESPREIPSSTPPAQETLQTTTIPEILSKLPIPFTPTTPNTLVGLTITPDSRILDGVLVEIKKNGLTLRATKSNKLGQFMFARPLENGTFQILAEKEGFQFAPYSLELTGAIVRPLKIQATS
jgi:hypothetical protein